jgi:hypothetical protein
MITITPIEITLAGKSYQLYPQTDAMNDALDEYCRGKFIESVRTISFGSVHYDSDMAIAFKEAINLSWNRPPCIKWMLKREGLAKLAWYATKQIGTYHDITEGMSEIEVEAFWEAWKRVNRKVENSAVNPPSGQGNKSNSSAKVSIVA